MKVVSPEESCEKCGGFALDMSHRELNAAETMENSGMRDMLAIKCKRCGYCWPRACLDAKR